MEVINNVIYPRALMMGVDYDLFWTLNPKSLSPFIKAFDLRQRYDDMVAWQSGIYIRLAVASIMDKTVKYPKRPLSEESKVVDKEVNGNQKMNKIKEAMMERMLILNQRFKKDGELPNG